MVLPGSVLESTGDRILTSIMNFLDSSTADDPDLISLMTVNINMKVCDVIKAKGYSSFNDFHVWDA